MKLLINTREVNAVLAVAASVSVVAAKTFGIKVPPIPDFSKAKDEHNAFVDIVQTPENLEITINTNVVEKYIENVGKIYNRALPLVKQFIDLNQEITNDWITWLADHEKAWNEANKKADITASNNWSDSVATTTTKVEAEQSTT